MVLTYRRVRRAAAIAGALALLAVAAPADAATPHPWRNVQSNRCMDADNGNSLNDGSTVNLYGCVQNKGNQMFIPVSRGRDSKGNEVYQFQVSARPSKCLDVRESDGRLQIWTCGAAGKLNQEFALVGNGQGGDTCMLPMYNEKLQLGPFGLEDDSPIYAFGGLIICGNDTVSDLWLETWP